MARCPQMANMSTTCVTAAAMRLATTSASPTPGETRKTSRPIFPTTLRTSISESHSGNALGFMAVDDAGFHAYVYATGQMHQPRFAHTKRALSSGPYLSHAAEIAVIASTENTGVAEYALEAYDVESGALIAELWDGAGSGINAGGFSPIAGDLRFAGSSNACGYHRPLIWNPAKGKRHDITSELFRGDVKVWHWSPDARLLLLHQVHQAQHALFVYDIAEQRVRNLPTPPGVLSPGSGFTEDGALQLHLSDSAVPARMIELDAESGHVLRNVIDLGVDVPPGVAWRSVTYPSSGGAQIQAWLATPPGAGPYPDDCAYAWRARQPCMTNHLGARGAGLARSWIRLLQPQLPRLNHLRL